MKNKNAFSVLEMIVAVGIAIILLNVAFSYYKIYLKNSRDEQRMTDLSEIKVGLDTLLVKNNILPDPIKSVNVTSSGEIVNTQGYVSADLVGKTGSYIDPLDYSQYTYVINKEKNRFQLLGLLENNWSEVGDINFGKRLPYTLGRELGVFLDKNDNSPVQQSSTENIETDSNMEKYIVYLDNDKYATEKDILKQMSFRINPKASCLHILKNGDSIGDGVYNISPDKVVDIKVYCDMTTDSGGWTLFYANNGYADSPIAESYTEMRTNVSTGQVYDLTDNNNTMLAGLIDYKYFTSNGATEILMKNHAVIDDELWGKIWFDKSETLEWALGDKVLGTGINKCIDLPKGASWGVTNDTGEESYKDLTQMMAHGGTSWGVSHLDFDCNSYQSEGVLTHVAFYSANSNDYTNRTRSNMMIGGTWGGENEYRYFVR